MKPTAPTVRWGTRKAANIAVWTVLCLLITVVGVFAVFVRTGHMRVVPILSGSMRPSLGTGDVAITRKVPVSSLHVGDIIVFVPPNTEAGAPPKIHRIVTLRHVGKDRVEFTTKGDANSIVDPWGAVTTSGTASKVVTHLPGIGWAINYGIHWITLGILLLLAGVITRWTVRYLRSPDRSRIGGNTS